MMDPEKINEPATVAPPPEPAAAPPAKPEQDMFDAKAAHEDMKKGLADFQADVSARLSRLESAWDELTKEEENEGDAKMAEHAEKPPEKPPEMPPAKPEDKGLDELKEKQAEHSKKMDSVMTEMTGMKKTIEDFGTALVKHGFQRTVGSTGVSGIAEDEIAKDAQERVRRRIQ